MEKLTVHEAINFRSYLNTRYVSPNRFGHYMAYQSYSSNYERTLKPFWMELCDYGRIPKRTTCYRARH